MKKMSIIVLNLLCATTILGSQVLKEVSSQSKPSEKKIAVIGTGYVGLVTGTGLAHLGNTVQCADVDVKKIAMLLNGKMPIHEPGLKELVDLNRNAGRLNFTADVAHAIQECDINIIAVGTPSKEDGSADLSYVTSVLDTIAKNINRHKTICTKSTVPIGTGAWIRKMLEERGVPSNMFDLVSNPEFLREGNAVHDFLNPDRVVLGVETEKSKDLMNKMYQPLVNQGVPFIITNLVTSETIKYASNAFLASKISYMNGIANLCDDTGADVAVVSRAIGLDKRVGELFLNPGPGFGGSCFPKDCEELLNTANRRNVPLPVVQAALLANESQKRKPVEKLLRLMNNDVKDKTIAILGLAFKGNTDDIRYSPALKAIEMLLERGAIIKAFDPVAMNNTKHVFPNIQYCSTIEDAVCCADAVIVMTEWQEFKNLNLQYISDLVRHKVLVDARNIVDIQELARLGFAYDTMGRGSSLK